MSKLYVMTTIWITNDNDEHIEIYDYEYPKYMFKGWRYDDNYNM